MIKIKLYVIFASINSQFIVIYALYIKNQMI